MNIEEHCGHRVLLSFGLVARMLDLGGDFIMKTAQNALARG